MAQPAKKQKTGAVAAEAPMSRVLIINTGGTIGMVDKGRGYEPEPGFMEGFLRNLSMFHDKDFYNPKTHGPGLITGVSKHGKRIYYEIIEYDPILDSSDMNMGDWVKIAKDVAKHYDAWDGFVVLHGTDTMAYTSSALAFMLQNLGKIVVLTGSQVPLAEQRNDGQSNLQGALIIAGHYVIPEVTLFFGNKLFRGCRASKVHASALSAFGSPNAEPLVKMGISVDVDWDSVFRHNKVAKFSIQERMENNVVTLRLFPGIRAETIRETIKAPVKGVVLQSFGAGNCPERKEILDVFEQASKAGVLILNLTQCHGGYVSAVYRAGQILMAVGVIAGGDMTIEAALTKLSYVLAQDNLSYAQKKQMLMDNIRGEVTVQGEHKFSLSNESFLTEFADAIGATNNRELKQMKKSLAPILLCCAVNMDNLPLVKALIAQGMDANSTDYDLRTPLHIASAIGTTAMIQHLLEHGASVHNVDRFGYTPLRDAVNKRNAAAIALLTSAGAKLRMTPIKQALSLCTMASDSDSVGIATWSDAGADINAADYDKRTALHVAAAAGNAAMVEQLLALPGIDRQPVDIAGLTPLAEATKGGFADVAALLQ